MLGQPGRRPASAHRNQQRITVKQAGRGEIAQIRAIDDIDQHAGTAQVDRGHLARFFVVISDKGDPHPFINCAALIIDNDPAGTFDQAARGLGRLSFAQHQHALPGNLVKQG